MTSTGSKIGFLIISILYLIIEIGFKGYATQILGDFNVYQYEVESLELIGRVISSFGIAFFISGFIKSKYKLPLFAGIMALLFVSQKLLFDHIHRLASTQVTETAYQVNLYKSGAYLFPELEQMMLYPYESKDTIGFKSFVGMLPLLLSGSETIKNFVLMNEEQFLERIKDNSFSEEDALRYHKHFDWKVSYPIKSLFKFYGENSNNNDVVDRFYYILANEVKDFSLHYYRRNLEKKKYISKRLSDNLLTFNRYVQEGKTPPISLVQRTMTELAATIGFDLLADTMITVFKRKYGLHLTRQDFGSFYYTDIAKSIKNNVKESVTTKLRAFIERDNKRPLTEAESALFNDIMLSFETPKDFFYHPKTAELFKTMDFIFIKNPQDLYQLIYLSEDKNDFIKILTKYMDKDLTTSQELSEKDRNLHVKMILVPPLVLLMSTIALYLNAFALFATLLSLFIQSKVAIRCVSLAAISGLLALPLFYESSLDPERKRRFHEVFSEKVGISDTKSLTATWLINNNIMYYNAFEPVEDFFLLLTYGALEPAIIEREKINGDKNWFLNEIKNKNKMDDMKTKIFKKKKRT